MTDERRIALVSKFIDDWHELEREEHDACLPAASGAPGQWLVGRRVAPPQSYYMLMPNGLTRRLLLFLHDVGQQDDLTAQIDPWFNSPQFRGNYPDVVVLAPVCMNEHTWGGVGFHDHGSCLNLVLSHVADLKATYGLTDLYITGNGMGGAATWRAIISHPMMFAAALVMAGEERTVHPQKAATALRHMPIWSVTDGSDVTGWNGAVFSLLRGHSMKYEVLAGVGGKLWSAVYADNIHLSWLLSHRSTVPGPRPQQAAGHGLPERSIQHGHVRTEGSEEPDTP